MARFLFVVPPLHGHINPTVSVGNALVERGHEVGWAGYPDPARALLPESANLLPVFDEMPSDIVETIQAKSQGLRGVAAMNFLWQDFLVPLARAMVEGVERAIDLFEPDALIVDQQALAGAIVAQRRGLTYATSSTTTAELTDEESLPPKVKQWIQGHLRGLQSEFGVDDAIAEKNDLRYSPHLVVIFSTPALMGRGDRYPTTFAFVGPAIQARPQTEEFPWDWLDDRPCVLASLGTVSAEVGGRFYQAAVEAFADPARQLVLVAPPDLVGPVPDHILVRSRVPQLALLPHLSAVICHGGHNTVCESLAHGLPLVVCPIRDDQPAIAQQVVRSGSGVRVRFGGVRGPVLSRAVDRVLGEPEFKLAAEEIAESFRRAGGAAHAALRLEEIA